MKIEYTVCDVCTHKIDFEKSDKSMGRVELLRVKTKVSMSAVKTAPALFSEQTIGDIDDKETVVKSSLDLCEQCSKSVFEKCEDLKREHNSKKPVHTVESLSNEEYSGANSKEQANKQK